MNKKILLFSILAVFMLLAISFSSAVSSYTTKVVEKKESPLFGIRLKKKIGDKLEDLKAAIKAKFIGERLFFLPFQCLRNREEFSVRDRYAKLTFAYTLECWETCWQTVAGCPCR